MATPYVRNKNARFLLEFLKLHYFFTFFSAATNLSYLSIGCIASSNTWSTTSTEKSTVLLSFHDFFSKMYFDFTNVYFFGKGLNKHSKLSNRNSSSNNNNHNNPKTFRIWIKCLLSWWLLMQDFNFRFRLPSLLHLPVHQQVNDLFLLSNSFHMQFFCQDGWIYFICW